MPCYFFDADFPLDLTVAGESSGDKSVLVVFDVVIGVEVAVEPEDNGEVHMDEVRVDGDVDLILVPEQSVEAVQLLNLGHQFVEVGVPDQIFAEQVYLLHLDHFLLLKGALNFPAVTTENSAIQERTEVDDVVPGVESGARFADERQVVLVHLLIISLV